MTFICNMRKNALVAFGAVMVVAFGSTLAHTQTQTNNNSNTFIAGSSLGGSSGTTSQPANNPYHPRNASCFKRWETRFNIHGQPYQVQVEYC